MEEGNRSLNPYRQLACLLRLLALICILLTCQVSSQIHVHVLSQHVAYQDVLKSTDKDILSHITQFDVNKTQSLICQHYPVYTGDKTKLVMFIWASGKETHAMKNCLQEMEATGKYVFRMIQSSLTSYPHLLLNSCLLYTSDAADE